MQKQNHTSRYRLCHSLHISRYCELLPYILKQLRLPAEAPAMCLQTGELVTSYNFMINSVSYFHFTSGEYMQITYLATASLYTKPASARFTISKHRSAPSILQRNVKKKIIKEKFPRQHSKWTYRCWVLTDYWWLWII